jgi:putative zinc-dependent peptidase DUF5700
MNGRPTFTMHSCRIHVSLLAILLVSTVSSAQSDRIKLKLDSSEAEAVLSILAKVKTGQSASDSDWQRLFSTEPYVRLKKREASMHREFTDDEFKKFVLSPDLSARAADLQRTLDDWKKADLAASARRILAYLPDEANIRAKVFPMIKPQTNSFVFESNSDAAIFLYLDPKEAATKFENTVAHELHHIGFASIAPQEEARFKDLPPNVKTVMDWMGGFGEGFAMLAAAGSPDVHPHASSPPEEWQRWDRDMENFNPDLKKVEKFFLDILDGRLKEDDKIREAGFSFFGVQGPWYTVGYKMAVMIERRYGRTVLIQCMQDPRLLIARYNAAAEEINRAGKEKLALWSPELVEKIAAKRQ